MQPPTVRTLAILDAAQALILRLGLRGTSMEAIAQAAGIAKPTLYARFPNKDAVFAALAERLAGEWRETFTSALCGEGDVADRVAAALTAKHKAVRRLLDGSPHAADLYGAHDKGGAPQLAALEGELMLLAERELEAAGVVRARLLTQLLFAAAQGVGRRAQTSAELGPALRLLTARLLGPELPGH